MGIYHQLGCRVTGCKNIRRRSRNSEAINKLGNLRSMYSQLE